METYIDNAPLWDLSQASNFSQLADDDFLTLLQKQFPASQDAGYVDSVNPQNITRLPLPIMTPPSEDSSPSPPNINDSGGNDEQADSAPKRKASQGDLDDESPSSKTQHTTKKATTARRKSSIPGQAKDESRLLKRKEQNRAAQRAFRERKEKHVKDLEDKVAALEAQNEAAVAENENLRDLLSRLQQENLSLKQASFTFAVPKNGGTPDSTQASTSFASQSPDFSSSSSSLSPLTPVSSSNPTFTPKMTNPLDWSSLTSFDPNMLSLLDDTPQPTATDGAMQLDLGFGAKTALPPNGPFTTIASNPMFVSYASAFDSSPALSVTQPSDNNNTFGVDWSNFSSSWQSPPVPQDSPSLDDLLAGYLTQGNSTALMPSSSPMTSESPVSHHANVSQPSSKPSPQSLSSSSSPSSSASDPLFDTPRDSSASDSDVQEANEKKKKVPCAGTGNSCPKTKGELANHISAAGSSPFAPAPLRKTSDAAAGPIISCAGTSFPKTAKSDQNIEVLSAWRSITSNPRFKDVDINDLCTEFTSKAKCDGTKVVLEPQGVNSIIQTLTGPKK
ncbi:hypothetical protein C0993_008507 [Termitomyces sp. T159_Od127]|nr:hypothetical protein C0993_008507 [Termitomyces sp. T159_Od127]